MPFAPAGGAGGYVRPQAPPRLAPTMGAPPNPFSGAGRSPLYQGGTPNLSNPTNYGYQPPTAPARIPQPQVPLAPQNTTPTASPFAAPQANLYDINTDPSLQQAYAYTGRQDQAAQAQATADKTRLVEQTGLGSLAQALGLGQDVASVATGNPFSTTADLLHRRDVAAQQLTTQNQQSSQTLGNQLNVANLLYGGYAQQQKQKLADSFTLAGTENTRGYQQGLSNLAGQVQSQAGSIESALANALAQNQQTRISAQQTAQQNALQFALANAYQNALAAQYAPQAPSAPTAPTQPATPTPQAAPTPMGVAAGSYYGTLSPFNPTGR